MGAQINKTNRIYAVIMAGGSGTRFWPVSRKSMPKQFLALGNSEESLIQSTARRIDPLLKQSGGDLLVVTNFELCSQVKEHLPQSFTIEEPCGRNTAACIGLAALDVLRRDPDGVMILLPADHSVADEQCLRDTLQRAISLAVETGGLVTVGIRPENPNTAYGYVQRGDKISESCYRVGRFYEKPNLERAIEYCEAGNFFWNSGMFVWKASAILSALEKHMPKLSAALGRINSSFGSKSYQQVLESEFEVLESVSIDLGVLEHADNCYMVESQSFGWNDVGSWDAWAQHFVPDKHGNISSADMVEVQAKNCIVYSRNSESKSRLISLLGVQDLVVVDTADALMVCERSKVQDVKLIVDVLKREGRTDLL